MSHRYPPIRRDDMEEAVDSGLKKQHGDNINFKYRDRDGAPIGPFAVLAYTPDVFEAYMSFADAILRQEDFEPQSRELAILAVTAVYDIPFVKYAHTRIASTVGLSDDQISAATTPKGLDEDQVVVYATALELARSRGPLSEESWQRAENVLGRARAARVAHVVGVYMSVGTLMRLGAIEAPKL